MCCSKQGQLLSWIRLLRTLPGWALNTSKHIGGMGAPGSADTHKLFSDIQSELSLLSLMAVSSYLLRVQLWEQPDSVFLFSLVCGRLQSALPRHFSWMLKILLALTAWACMLHVLAPVPLYQSHPLCTQNSLSALGHRPIGAMRRAWLLTLSIWLCSCQQNPVNG